MKSVHWYKLTKSKEYTFPSIVSLKPTLEVFSKEFDVALLVYVRLFCSKFYTYPFVDRKVFVDVTITVRCTEDTSYN